MERDIRLQVMRGWFYKFENTKLIRENRKLRLGMTDTVVSSGNPLLLGRPVVPAQVAVRMIGPIPRPELPKGPHHCV